MPASPLRRPLNVLLEPDVRALLEAMATADHRSLTKTIELIVRAEAERRGIKPPRARRAPRKAAADTARPAA